ncbi:hypothetical protein SEA_LITTLEMUNCHKIN_48 [Gordonia phage LittleMunchkin]|nr:hypothetical protein SEA_LITTLEMUNCHKIN_48 [Gordonia phage LittleMunchkin]
MAALTFKTADLIAAAQTIIDNHDKRSREWDADAEKARKAAVNRWDDGGGFEDMRALRDILTAALKRHDPLTTQQARRALGKKIGRSVSDIEVAVFAPTVGDYEMRKKLGNRPDPIVVTNYQALVGILQAHTEPTITAAQLKAVGFGDLAALYRTVATLTG